MVRPHSPGERLEKALIRGLLKDNPPENRCKHFMVDEVGPYCGRDWKEGDPIEDQRRACCDNYSLQLWCLDKNRSPICIWYQGEPFELPGA